MIAHIKKLRALSFSLSVSCQSAKVILLVFVMYMNLSLKFAACHRTLVKSV